MTVSTEITTKKGWFWTPSYEAMIKSKQRKAYLDPRYKLFNSTKSTALHRGLEHNIDIDDIVFPEKCPVFGIPLLKSGRENNSPSVDRVDSSKGYVKGNVRIISLRANRLKSNATVEELEQLLAYMKNNT